jgi:hypothetical protein
VIADKMKNEPARQSTGLRKRIQTWIRHHNAFDKQKIAILGGNAPSYLG